MLKKQLIEKNSAHLSKKSKYLAQRRKLNILLFYSSSKSIPKVRRPILNTSKKTTAQTRNLKKKLILTLDY